MRRMTKLVPLAAVMLFGAAPLIAQNGHDMAPMHAVDAGALTWVDLDVPGFDAGMKLGVIHGDPGVAGPYTIRLSFPPGYRFPAHWHPMAENLTVLSGTLMLGMGDTVDDTKLKSYGAGDFLHIPAKHPHFGGARGATVIQLHGTGPFTIELSKPGTM